MGEPELFLEASTAPIATLLGLNAAVYQRCRHHALVLSAPHFSGLYAVTVLAIAYISEGAPVYKKHRCTAAAELHSIPPPLAFSMIALGLQEL